MKYLKRYNEGGGIPYNPNVDTKTNDMLRHLSSAGENNELKYDVSDLMDILSFSKGPKAPTQALAGNVNFSFPGEEAPPTPPEDFVSYRTKKKGDTRISDYNEEKGGYNASVGAMGLKEGQLEKLAGRPLKGSQEADFREILSDPTLLRYFMDMMEEDDVSFRKNKGHKIKPVRITSAGVGTGGGQHGQKGVVVEKIIDGVAYICMDGSCKPK